jgi:hypothetical protein
LLYSSPLTFSILLVACYDFGYKWDCVAAISDPPVDRESGKLVDPDRRPLREKDFAVEFLHTPAQKTLTMSCVDPSQETRRNNKSRPRILWTVTQ